MKSCSKTLIFLVCILLISACSEVKSPVEEAPDALWPSTGLLSPMKAVFPHKPDWGKYSIHGYYVVKYGNSQCRNTCHGEDLKGGSTKGCNNCHKDIYPHPALWSAITGHGKFLKEAESYDKCATNCHGEDFKGGFDPLKKKSCYNCHRILHPFTTVWNEKDHGPAAIKSGSFLTCTVMCHRSNVPKEMKIKGCNDCHQGFPHPKNWQLATGHGLYLSKNVDADVVGCKKCHGDKLGGGTSKVACANSKCHHTGGMGLGVWADQSEHGFAGKLKKKQCEVCHGKDFSGGIVGIECSTICHGEIYPHKKGWIEPSKHGLAAASLAKCKGCHKDGGENDCKNCHHGITQDKKDKWKNSEHGAKVATGKSVEGCKACHGASLDGGVAGIACGKCHGEGYPHAPDWGLKENHGATAAKTGAFDKCLVCHNGGVNSYCITCHHTNDSDWKSNHGGKAVESVDECKLCHGADLGGGLSGKACKLCHGDNFPHKQGWISKSNHGDAAIKDVSKCGECHIDTKENKNDCKKCHHENWMAKYGVKYSEKSQHGAKSKVSDVGCKLKICHGEKLDGGLSGVTCQAPVCHSDIQNSHKDNNWKEAKPPLHGSLAEASKENLDKCLGCHKDGINQDCKKCHHMNQPDWATKDHGPKAKDKALIAGCKVCHGAGLDGGLSGKACKTCHGEGFPHKAGWDGGSQHGSYAKADIKACLVCHKDAVNQDVCKKCHHGNENKLKDWIDKDHGPKAAPPGAIDGCKVCHGTLLAGGLSGKKCENCHGKNYPHGKGWGEGNNHKLAALNDMGNCIKCHITAKKNDCKKCHHDNWKEKNNVEWKDKSQHGAGAALSTGGCKLCHGETLDGGLSGQTCQTDCHKGIPFHGVGWSDKHGDGFALTLSNCTGCHNEGIQKECIKCHHGATPQELSAWSGEPHSIRANNNLKGCKVCHGEELAGGLAQKPCSNCHGAGWPHVNEWEKGTVHGPVAIKEINFCATNCHKDGVNDFCKSCHHSNNKADWINSIHKSSAKQSLEGCKVCHGSSFTGGLSGKACYKSGCHIAFPHPPPGFDYDGASYQFPTWPKYTGGHGEYVVVSSKKDKSNIKNFLANECADCHFSAKTGWDICAKCHSGFPHATDWATSKHGAAYMKEKSVCKNACHGTDLLGGTSGVGCNKCHNAFPHKPNMKETHGSMVLTAQDAFDTTAFDASCKICHGPTEGFTEKIPSVTVVETENGVPNCYKCHASYPHVKYSYLNFNKTDTKEALWQQKIAHLLYVSDAPKNFLGEGVFSVNSFGYGCAGETAAGCHTVKRHPTQALWPGAEPECTTFCHPK